MKTLYLLLDIGVILFPVLLSFDKKVHYVSEWKYVLGAIFFIGLPFLIHDYCFTHMGIWGFNSTYLTGSYIGNLPIEEVLFFVVVPFSCVFIHQCCQAYFNHINFRRFNQLFYAVIFIYCGAIFFVGIGAWYSTMVAVVAVWLWSFLVYNKEKYPYLPIAFILSMIPFFMMNGVLTGGMTVEPIVWYNNLENIGFRWWTIPAEDILYSFILIGGNIIVFNYLSKRKTAMNN